MRSMAGRAAALALLAMVCVTSATADASSAHGGRALPGLTMPRRPDGLVRALAGGRISAAQEALLRAQALFEPARVAARYGTVARPGRRDATMILRDLAVRLGQLSPDQQKLARGILARPADAFDSTTNPEGWPDGEDPSSPDCGPDVCVHWAAPGADAPAATDTTPANGVPDWVDSTLATVEDVWNAEVVDMGYRAPLSDTTSTDHGPDGKLDVYISNLGPQQLYGYCTSDDPKLATLGQVGVTWDVSAYCVVDNNYAEAIFGNHTPLENLQVTLAHEFFHAVQFAYDVGEDRWLMEGTATWMEDQVYTAINDNRQYLQNSPLKYPWVPLDHSNSCCFQYGSWIWFRYLSESMNPTVIQQIWDRAASAGGPDDYSSQAVSNVLKAHGTTFRRKFGDFAVWNRIPAKRYSEGGHYPTPVGSGSFSLGSTRKSTGWLGVKLKHMSSVYVTFKPSRTDGRRAHLTVQYDGPRIGYGPEGRLIVFSKSGTITVRRYALNRLGDGSLRVAFGRGHIRRVVLVESNASIRFSCWNGTQYSCQGVPRDDGRVYSFRARIS
jgi:hypothetical protein